MSQTVTTSPASDAASPRRIAALALPALVVLAAEPLYVLVDTAVVGHLGRVPLAALAVGGTVMTLTAWLGTVVAYGTTGRSARRFGAGDRAAAVAEGVQASWLALAVGVLVALAMQFGAGLLARTLVGGSGEVADAAAQLAAHRRARRPRPAARRRRQRLAARHPGHPPAAALRARPQPAVRAALPAAGLSRRARPGRFGGGQRHRADPLRRPLRGGAGAPSGSPCGPGPG